MERLSFIPFQYESIDFYMSSSALDLGEWEMAKEKIPLQKACLFDNKRSCPVRTVATVPVVTILERACPICPICPIRMKLSL